MSESKDYQALARKFVDLWQEQMAAMVNDSEFVRALLQMMQSAPFPAKDGAPYASAFTAQSSGGATPASDAGTHAMARIERCLAAIEERLDRLERDHPAHKRFAGARRSSAGVVHPNPRPRTRTGGGKRGKKKGH